MRVAAPGSLMHEIAVVILNWNNGPATTTCIAHVLRSHYPFVTMFVVDNGSSDGSLEMIRSFLAGSGRRVLESSFNGNQGVLTEDPRRESGGRDVHLVSIDRNLGYGGGNNVGIGLAIRSGAEAIWVINNDTRPEPGALDAIIATAASAPASGMIGSMVLMDDGTDRIQCIGGGRYDWAMARSTAIGEGLTQPAVQDRRMPEPDFIDGSAIFLTREFVLDVGAFEEAYHLYCEEIDLAQRALARGWRWSVARGSIVRHGFRRDDRVRS